MPLISHSPKPRLGKPNNVEIDDIDELDGEGQNIILGIISQLRLGSDLSRITLPTFILERKSMLERITNQLQHPEILLHAHTVDDPVARFVEVVKWSLSGWHIAPKAVKKPLNPVLGEYFSCYWDLENNTKAFYIAEQTSHHPPKSSYFYMSPENRIRVDGILIPRSKFLGNSAASMMEGVAFLKFLDIKDSKGNSETYEITQPNIYARGILLGKLKYELCDHSIVRCESSGLEADIDFKAKGFITGTYNAIQGEIRQISSGKVLYEITGKWNEVMEIKNLKTGKKSVFFDASKEPRTPPLVRELDQQGDLESRKLWKNVTDALAARDHIVATDEKFAIEDRQRKEARQRAEEGVEFHPKLFKQVSTPIQFQIYKDIDDNSSPEAQTQEIFSMAPILPGQDFHATFEIPAYQKHEVLSKEKAAEGTESASTTAGTSTTAGPLENLIDLNESLPKGSDDDDDDDDDDDFVDAES